MGTTRQASPGLLPIIAMVGPSGAGKSELIRAICRELPEAIGVVKSVTDRAPRGPEDRENYDFVTPAGFDTLRDAGELIQGGGTGYAGGRYDNIREDNEALLRGRIGIAAWIEPTIPLFRGLGYAVAMVRVRPAGKGFVGRGAERAKADAEREDSGPRADFVIVNDFGDAGGFNQVGFDRALNELRQIVATVRQHG